MLHLIYQTLSERSCARVYEMVTVLSLTKHVTQSRDNDRVKRVFLQQQKTGYVFQYNFC